jgi:hypothetical protein
MDIVSTINPLYCSSNKKSKKLMMMAVDHLLSVAMMPDGEGSGSESRTATTGYVFVEDVRQWAGLFQ